MMHQCAILAGLIALQLSLDVINQDGQFTMQCCFAKAQVLGFSGQINFCAVGKKDYRAEYLTKHIKTVHGASRYEHSVMGAIATGVSGDGNAALTLGEPGISKKN